MITSLIYGYYNGSLRWNCAITDIIARKGLKVLFLDTVKVQTQKVSLLICQLCEDVIYYRTRMTLKGLDITMESCLDIFSVPVIVHPAHAVVGRCAARHFISLLREQETLPLIREIEIELYGALSLSRKCHNVDTALYLGLLGCQPENVDPRPHGR